MRKIINLILVIASSAMLGGCFITIKKAPLGDVSVAQVKNRINPECIKEAINNVKNATLIEEPQIGKIEIWKAYTYRYKLEGSNVNRRVSLSFHNNIVEISHDITISEGGSGIDEAIKFDRNERNNMLLVEQEIIKACQIETGSNKIFKRGCASFDGCKGDKEFKHE
ncbi:MAG: hypothetical protein ABL857_07305 [Rickettsiales bacterium]